MANFKVGDRVRIKNPNRQIGQDDGTYEVTLIRPDGMVSIKAPSERVGFAVRPEQLIANAARSRNAVVQKALNAMARNIRAIPVDSKGKGIIERCKIRTADGEVAEVAHIDEDGFVYFKSKDGQIRGVPADTVIRLNAATSTVRAKACNAASDDPDALEAAKALQTAIRSAESAIGSAKKAKNPGAKRNVKMIADALENLRIAFYGVRVANAAACNAKFRVFLDNGRETEIVATSESSASDKVLQKFKFWGDKAPKVSRVVRLKPVVSGRFVGKANGLEYYVDYTDDLGFAKKYGKDGTNVTEIHINTPYLKDEDGRERRHIVYTWSRGSEWIGDKFKHPDFPDAARAARDLAAKLIRSNPNVAKIGDDTNDWR